MFGATLPHIFDAKVYKLGDPVHFHVHGRLAVPISDHVCEAFHTLECMPISVLTAIMASERD